MAQSVQDLIVWQRATELTVCIYKLTQRFPKDEIYGLSSEMLRASVSVASNIAEGRGRLSPAEFRQFLGLAQGSLFEVRTQLIVAKRLGMAESATLEHAESLSQETSKMLVSLINKLGIPQRRSKALRADG